MIKDHKIVGVDFRKTENTSGFIKEHKVIVLHHCSGTWEGTTSWIMQTKPKKNLVSYHDYISKNGQERQFVEFNRRAFHAGVSQWKGLKNLNDWGVGVSFQNTGNESFPDAQVEKGILRCKSLIEVYGYEDMARHRDIAPDRRNDPNSKFPWEEFQREVYGRPSIESVARLNVKKVTASGLNVRSSPNSSNSGNIITSIVKGTEVMVLGDQSGWSDVVVCSSKIRGWVSSQHIK